MKKTLTGTVAGVVLMVGLMGSAFAADSSQSGTPKQDKQAKHQVRVEQKAALKGLSVEQWTQKHQAMKTEKEQKAQAAGLTLEQYREKQQADKQLKLKAGADKKGITVEQYTEQKKAQHAEVVKKATEQGLTLKQIREQQKEQRKAEKLVEKQAKKQAKQQLKAANKANKKKNQPRIHSRSQ